MGDASQRGLDRVACESAVKPAAIPFTVIDRNKRSKGMAVAVHRDSEILGGIPVFFGTRVPFQALIDYLEAGHPLSRFLRAFPTVTRKQALAALDEAKEALLAKTRAA